MELGFLANPGYKYRDRRPEYIPRVTAGNEHWKLLEQEPKIKGSWLMLYDEVMNPRGVGSILFDPEEVKQIKFSAKANSSMINVIMDVRSNSFRFMLQGVPESYLDAEAVFEDLLENSEELLKQLKLFQF